MDVAGLDIQWKSTKLPLKEAITKEELPQILQVTHKYTIDSSECLYDEDRIVVHGVKTVAQLRGKDGQGRQSTFATACPFELKYSVLDTGIVYKTVGDLCAAKPVPKCVKMTGNVQGEEAQCLQKDEKLKVLLTERNEKGPSFVHFRSERGKHLRLSVAFEGNFVTCPIDDNVYTLEVLATKELPLCVEFLPLDGGKFPFDKKLGTITLTEGLTSEYVFATTKRKGKIAALILPLSSDLKVQQVSTIRNSQGTEMDISQGIELPKFSTHLGMHKLESVSSGILAPYESLAAKQTLKSKASIKSVTSEDDTKEKPEPEKSQPKRKESESPDKKAKGVKEKAYRRMSKAKMLVKKRHKSVDNRNENENEASTNGHETNVESAGDHNANQPVKTVEDAQVDNTSENGTEDMYLPPSEVEPPSPQITQQQTAQANDVQVQSNVEAPLYDDAEIPTYDDAEIPTYDDAEIPTYDDLGAAPENSDDDYEMPEGSAFRPPQDTYEAPIHATPSPTMPRTNKEKGEKGILSKMWKKVKKGATLPNMTPNQLKKMQKHINGDDVDGRGRSPSDASSPPSVPEPIPTFDDEDLYEEIGEGYVSSDLVKAARSAHRFSFSSAPLPPKPTDSGDSGFGDEDLKELQNWRSKMPPDLPGNHPIANERGGTIKFKNFCDGVKASEAEIRKWGLDEVEDTLRKLMLENFIDQFIDNQIDGPLLVDLDEAVLRDLGMGIFEARKLRKFVFGWRPDCMKTDGYCGLKKLNSSDPMDWDESEVVDHLKTLTLNSFANFCSDNQVNGDLLVDIVADDEVLNNVLKDGKLKTVKLKKYVLEGWRPQSKVYETREEIREETPDTYEIPSPTEEKKSFPRKEVKSEAVKMTKMETEVLNRSNSSPSVAAKATVAKNGDGEQSGGESPLQGKFKQAKDTYLKQANKEDTKRLADRKTLKESPLIANIKQQLMEKSGTAAK